jgi:pimeloyl-ACP methyl ester carboxylesterase
MNRAGGVLLSTLLVVCAVATPLVLAQESSSLAPTHEQLKALAARTSELGKLVASIRRQGVADQWLSDIEIYHRAASLAAQHQEITSAQALNWAREAVGRGLLRARLAATGELPWLQMAGQTIARGHRSRIDSSLQPYAVTFPANYGSAASKRWRLDVVLHGRENALNEVKFLHQHNGDQAIPREQDYVQLEVFGRGNNAYRWAGETDVLETIDAFVATERQLGRDKLLDPARVVLRGFSMGGAGAWHLGLHLPDRWCLIGPGAGFTATHGYVKSLPRDLPPWQEACLSIYDAIDYAENAFDVPIVGYAGADDRLLVQMRNLESRLKSLGLPMTLLVAQEVEHQFPAEWQKKAEQAYAPLVAKGRAEYPNRVRFVTYTLRYSRCDWVEILGLEQHYRRALVDAQKTEAGFTVQTSNVQCLHLTLPVGAPQSLVVSIDGQPVACRPVINPAGAYNVFLLKQGKRWTAVLPQRLVTDQARQPRKAQGLQGPIDDAFAGSFLCVMGTDQPWHAATQKLAVANLERFRAEWSKHWRGELPIKDDVDVNNDDLASKNLILFGDPASNALIAQVLDGLPLRWTRDTLTFAGKSYSSADHLPVLIYPSPLNATRYVVLNSGHTFPTSAYEGSNALLYPRLGDYAVLRITEVANADVVIAGLFDERWQPREHAP